MKVQACSKDRETQAVFFHCQEHNLSDYPREHKHYQENMAVFFLKSYWIVCIFLLTLPIPPKTFTSRKLLPHITESRTELDKVFPFILSFAKDFDQDCSLSPWRFAAVVTDFFSFFFLTFNIHFFVSTKTNKRAVLEGDADFQLLERSGIDLETVLSNLSSPQSYYRFSEAEV